MQIDILIFALVAAFLVHRLRSVLGTRHGDEKPRANPFDAANNSAKDDSDIVTVGPRNNLHADDGEFASPAGLDSGMVQIAMADSGFDSHTFIAGAREAFPMVVQAFAKGDRETLRGLLSDSLYEAFEGSITEREEKGRELFTEILSVKEARPVDATLDGSVAYITVKFKAEETTYVKDEDGNIVEGDPDGIVDMEDVWTFARDTRSRDPNWILVETKNPDNEKNKYFKDV